MSESTAIVIDDRSFFGHPRGLAYLAFTEAWERFSFYGMRALVVLFMVEELLLPGHIENVVGMATLRGALEAVLGPLSPQALASLIIGFYGGLVYFTPLLGGWLADRWLGAKKTVLIGVFMMTAGHAAMVLEKSFLLALLLLIIGSGCLKGNIAAQVGQLYRRDDESRSTRGFVIFGTGINVGAVLGPIVCGALAQVYGWHVGFGTAGVLMLFAVALYLAGQKYMPDEKPRGVQRERPDPLCNEDRRRIALLLIVMSISIFQSTVYDQFLNVGVVWVYDHVSLETGLGTIPVTWFNSIDSFVAILIAPAILLTWARLARSKREPGDVSKIGIGAAIMAGASALLALSAAIAGDGKTGPTLAVTAFALSGVAFMLYWPTLLALVSRSAPKSVTARMISLVYVTLFVDGILMGYIGTLYAKMSPSAFWWLNTSISLAGAVLVLLFGRSLNRGLSRDARVTETVPDQAAVVVI